MAKTKLEIIQETIAWYTSNPRSVVTKVNHAGEAGERCVYKGPNGVECAFQRCVLDDLSPFEDKTAKRIITELKPDLRFKEGYEGHDASFWDEIQHLHDCWMDENGVKDDRKTHVGLLIKQYS